MTRYVLVHSPLVGPSSWRWVADELQRDGHDVLVPAVSPSTLAGGVGAVVREVAAQTADLVDAVFVAHSGAGPILASIVAHARAVRPALVFVDAGVPAEDRPSPLMPEDLLEHLRSLADGAMLPPWSEWFGPDVIELLLPDQARRRLVVAELPRVPLAYLTGVVPAVRPWPATRNGYVLLSAAYDRDALVARERGWIVVELPGAHLDLVTRPRAVADAIYEAMPAT